MNPQFWSFEEQFEEQYLLMGYSRKKTNRAGGGWLRIWNFQGYQRNRMWSFQGLSKNEVEFPRVTKENYAEFAGALVL